MDGCLDGCAGCFLWIAAFVIAMIIAYVVIGVFWIALVIGGIILLGFGIINWIAKIFRR